MAVEGNWDDPKYTGFSKYFNSYTIRGRSNWAKLWVSFYAITYIAYRMIKKRSVTNSEVAEPQVLSMADNSDSYNSSKDEDHYENENEGSLASEEKLDLSEKNLPQEDPTPYSSPRISGPQPTPQHPHYSPPVFYPCYPPPYFFCPPPSQPNQPPGGHYCPPCPYGHYHNAAPPTQTPVSSECSPNLHQQHFNSACHAPQQYQVQNACNMPPPQNECPNIQPSPSCTDVHNQNCNN